MNPREVLLRIHGAALAAVAGDAVVHRWLRAHPDRHWHAIVALGKAAEQMAAGALEALRARGLRPPTLVITKALMGRLQADTSIRLLESDHPIPGAASLAAGGALLDFIAAQPADARLLFLLSGGASALVEVPAPGVDLALLERCNQWLLGSGLPIDAVNAVRRRLSALKGGGLLRMLGGRAAEVLLISDVAGDDPAVIGSGPLWPSPPPPLPTRLPQWLRKALPPARPTHARPPPHHRVADLRQALEGAAQEGHRLGLPVHLDPEPLAGDARQEGETFARRLCQGPPGLHVKGGETTVELPPRPGRGGRNQHLALAAAQVLAGDTRCLVLAAGTDGSDGPTEAAGALVDGGTLARGCRRGLDPDQALAAADAGTFLAASGDLVITGPTGTNVTDLLLGLKLDDP